MRANLLYRQPVPLHWDLIRSAWPRAMSAVAQGSRRRERELIIGLLNLLLPAVQSSIGPAFILACHAVPQPLVGRWQWQGLGRVVPLDGSGHWPFPSLPDECLRDSRLSNMTFPALFINSSTVINSDQDAGHRTTLERQRLDGPEP